MWTVITNNQSTPAVELLLLHEQGSVGIKLAMWQSPEIQANHYRWIQYLQKDKKKNLKKKKSHVDHHGASVRLSKSLTKQMCHDSNYTCIYLLRFLKKKKNSTYDITIFKIN